MHQQILKSKIQDEIDCTGIQMKRHIDMARRRWRHIDGPDAFSKHLASQHQPAAAANMQRLIPG